ncbi:MAG TPA: type II toxin-antitoxin system death-on-curing family toxin [Thermoanaerobaculia bacterium]|nr:type II toxin-antitoxin system death-on-curing family toxin [Thermoanaerobaculia bacterium]
MREPRWLSRLVIDTMHSELVLEHRGSPGTRDGGDDLIESALARPSNRFAYEPTSDLAELAAAYLFGLVKNHGFIDGIKRIGFIAATTFLRLNGLRPTASEADAYDTVIALVEDRLTEEDVARWFRAHSEPAHE